MQKFILICSDGGSGDGFRLVGPFPSAEERQFWGEHWQMENRDDPCWQGIDLPNFEGPVYPLPVTKPERLGIDFLDYSVKDLKAKVKQCKELRKILRERERRRVEHEEAHVASSAGKPVA